MSDDPLDALDAFVRGLAQALGDVDLQAKVMEHVDAARLHELAILALKNVGDRHREEVTAELIELLLNEAHIHD